MTKPSDENKLIAQIAVKIFGGIPNIREYFDDNGTEFISILTCEGAPQNGVNSYSTLGLSDAPVADSLGGVLQFGVEIVAACQSSAIEFSNVISTCAFNILKDKKPIFPGCVFPRVFDMYNGLSSTLSHAFFVAPFMWNDEFLSRKLDTKTVAFLQLIPISDSELRFLQRNGPDALEDEFERVQIDIFDINRPPAV